MRKIELSYDILEEVIKPWWWSDLQKNPFNFKFPDFLKPYLTSIMFYLTSFWEVSSNKELFSKWFCFVTIATNKDNGSGWVSYTLSISYGENWQKTANIDLDKDKWQQVRTLLTNRSMNPISAFPDRLLSMIPELEEFKR